MSTASFEHGTFVITTAGDGIARFSPSIPSPAVADQEWDFDDVRLQNLYVRSTAGVMLHFVPRLITIPTIGTLTLLVATT